MGIIDFNESCYPDEAADFMDIGDERICAEMPERYGADAVLRRKVVICRRVRPPVVVQTLSPARKKERDRPFASAIRFFMTRQEPSLPDRKDDALAGLAALIIVMKKKKKPALAEGAKNNDEDDE